MSAVTTDDWVNFLAHSAALKSSVDLYAAATGLPKPAVRQDYPDKVLTSPSGVLADYLYWVTLYRWGEEAVPAKFLKAAKARWPKIRLGKR